MEKQDLEIVLNAAQPRVKTLTRLPLRSRLDAGRVKNPLLARFRPNPSGR